MNSFSTDYVFVENYAPNCFNKPLLLSSYISHMKKHKYSKWPGKYCQILYIRVRLQIAIIDRLMLHSKIFGYLMPDVTQYTMLSTVSHLTLNDLTLAFDVTNHPYRLSSVFTLDFPFSMYKCYVIFFCKIKRKKGKKKTNCSWEKVSVS